MRLIVADQQKFARRGDGFGAMAKGYDRMFRHYLSVFDEVVVLGQALAAEDPSSAPVTGPAVSLVATESSRHPLRMLAALPAMRRRLAEAYAPEDAYLLRMPGLIPELLGRRLLRERHPFAVEVAGDPWLTFGPAGNRHPLQPLLRAHFTRVLRRQCAAACAVGYSSRAQHLRYLPAPGAFVTHYSYAALPDDGVVAAPRQFEGGGCVRLVCVAGLQRMYKAPEVVLDAVGRRLADGRDLEQTWVGGGRLLEPMRARARRLGLEERVRFVGQLPAGQAVVEQLDAADLFLLPSRAEGLPGALIEAMARALPCIGSTVGGIPELLAEQDLVAPGDARALAAKIAQVVTDPGRMNDMSQRNRQTAQGQRECVVAPRRRALYEALRRSTEDWLASR